MKPNASEEDTRNRHRHALHDAEGLASGAMVGAVVGAAAGPPGMVAGAVIGAVAGGIAAMAIDSDEDRRAARTKELDDEIGVTGGDLGAPNLQHPPATVGAYSVAAAGAETSVEVPAEGPNQVPGE
jgi:phage tail tape-measure protein